MRMLLLAAAMLAATSAALAQPAAVVEGVQMPAWIERDGKAPAPLTPGMELKSGDRLRTGAGARLLLKLAEGSFVKLGENGRLQLAELLPSKDLFKATLGVLEGAFRFTTDLVVKQRRRDININVAQVTAGIRGTDLWGRSRADNQIVCLIEGKIEVGAPEEKPVTMDQPLQFYQRSAGKTQPVAFVDRKQLDEWARETEIEKGRGALRRGGTWKLELAVADDQAGALAAYDPLRAAGYPAEIRPTKEGDKLRYVVRIAGLPSKAEAEALGAQLRGMKGVAAPRVTR
ncbi:MAG TPA: FecR domain-containing protein [Burkholderiales bacterium]|nr:FecR domain-containing protein [Burkholderiales bacterium]